MLRTTASRCNLFWTRVEEEAEKIGKRIMNALKRKSKSSVCILCSILRIFLLQFLTCFVGTLRHLTNRQSLASAFYSSTTTTLYVWTLNSYKTAQTHERQNTQNERIEIVCGLFVRLRESPSIIIMWTKKIKKNGTKCERRWMKSKQTNEIKRKLEVK